MFQNTQSLLHKIVVYNIELHMRLLFIIITVYLFLVLKPWMLMSELNHCSSQA